MVSWSHLQASPHLSGTMIKHHVTGFKMDASFVLDGLYLGSLDSVVCTDKLNKLGISHILTIESRPVPRDYTKGYNTKFVHAFDMESQDLLQHVDECIHYIDEGRAAGGVLVHCFVGQSRSATIVLAYLMQKMDMNLQDAISMLKCSRPVIRPNEGFQQQLALFESMGNIIDKNSSVYKQYRLEKLAIHMQEAHSGSALPEDMLSADPSQTGTDQSLHYKCKKCRRPLFKAQSKLEHTVGKGGAAFDWRAHSKSQKNEPIDTTSETCQASLFIEPVMWMKDEVLQQTGKLSCPKCHAKLGSFSWFGAHCSCGAWVTPAFHIQASKVDECRPRPTAQSRPILLRTPQTLNTSQLNQHDNTSHSQLNQHDNTSHSQLNQHDNTSHSQLNQRDNRGHSQHTDGQQ